MRLPLAPQIIQSERKRLKTTSSSFQLWLGFGKGTEDADPRTRSWGLRGDSEQKKGSQGIWRHKGSLSGEIAARTSGEEQQDSWARVAEHPSPRGFHDSKYISPRQLENRPGPERGWATAQPFRSFPETRLWFPEPEPKPAGTEETARAPWGDQDSGSDSEQVIFRPVKTTFSRKRQLPDRGFCASSVLPDQLRPAPVCPSSILPLQSSWRR